MRKLKLENLHQFLSQFNLTQRASEYFSELLDFKISGQLRQDRLVELGQILSRVISIEFTLRLGDKGFNQQLIDNAIDTLIADVERMISTFTNAQSHAVVEDYQESSSWLKSITPQYVHS